MMTKVDDQREFSRIDGPTFNEQIGTDGCHDWHLTDNKKACVVENESFPSIHCTIHLSGAFHCVNDNAPKTNCGGKDRKPGYGRWNVGGKLVNDDEVAKSAYEDIMANNCYNPFKDYCKDSRSDYQLS